MIFEGKLLGTSWSEGEVRTSRMVLIGVGLDTRQLTEQFNECLAAPLTAAATAPLALPAAGSKVASGSTKSKKAD